MEKGKARVSRPKQRRGVPTLTAEDWEDAAIQLIAEAGVHALTVDSLARRLNVTKGSFYWHFKGRPDLLKKALARWEHRTVDEMIAALRAVPDPRQRLRLMLDAAFQPPRSRSLHTALAEAASDPVVRRTLNRVATARIGHLESCYRELGLAPDHAKATAAFVYSAYRGLLQIAREAPDSLPSDWSSYRAVVERSFAATVPRGRQAPRSRKAL